MSKCNDTFQVELLQVGTFEVEHVLDSSTANLVGDGLDFGLGAVGSTKAGLDERFAMGFEQLPDTELRHAADLDELGETCRS